MAYIETGILKMASQFTVIRHLGKRLISRPASFIYQEEKCYAVGVTMCKLDLVQFV